MNLLRFVLPIGSLSAAAVSPYTGRISPSSKAATWNWGCLAGRASLVLA